MSLVHISKIFKSNKFRNIAPVLHIWALKSVTSHSIRKVCHYLPAWRFFEKIQTCYYNTSKESFFPFLTFLKLMGMQRNEPISRFLCTPKFQINCFNRNVRKIFTTEVIKLKKKNKKNHTGLSNSHLSHRPYNSLRTVNDFKEGFCTTQ